MMNKQAMQRRAVLRRTAALALQCSLPLAGMTAVMGSGLARAAGAVKSADKSTDRKRIVVLGDSLSAEYGLARGSGWVALLQQRLSADKLASKAGYEVVNASISGDTTAGGRARLAAVLAQHKPALLIIELGGNDALRGLPVASARENLVAMVRAGKAAGAKVLLLGIQAPPNMGRAYGEDFSAMFEQIAKAEKTAVLPFLLAGVADRPDADGWFQSDRIHPLAKAHPLMLDQIWRVLKPLL